MNETLKRVVECDLPALSAILPDIILAKMGDKSADLTAAAQVISYTIANLRELAQA